MGFVSQQRGAGLQQCVSLGRRDRPQPTDRRARNHSQGAILPLSVLSIPGVLQKLLGMTGERMSCVSVRLSPFV